MEEAHAHKHTHIHKAKEVTEKKMRKNLERQKKKKGKKTLELRECEQDFGQAKLCDMLKGTEKGTWACCVC